MLFTRAYCAAPACNPSRAALLTGIRPSTSGVYLNSHPWRPALPKAVTLPQHFSAHGYRSIGGGKIFHGGYANGSEELYDHTSDPQEWTNLATREDLGKVRSELAKWLPQVNVPNADSAVSRNKKRVSKRASK